MKIKLYVAVMVMAVSLVAAACGNSASTGSSGSTQGSSEGTNTVNNGGTEPAVELPSLRISRESGPSSGLLFIADDQGFISDQGLEYEIVSFANGAEAVDSLQAGQIQVAFGAADTFPIRGVDSGIIGLTAVSQQPEAVSIVVSSDVEGPEDLKGRSIGIVPGSVSQYVLENMYLADAGLTRDDYSVTQTGPAEMVALMARGDIDAFALWDPFPANAVKALGDKVKLITTSGELGIPNTTYLLVSKDSLSDEAYTAAYGKLIRALQQAQTFLKENPEEAGKIIGAATQLTEEEMAERLAQLRLEVFMDDSAVDEIDNYNEILSSTGAIPEKIDISQVLDQEFVSRIAD